ncbi:MAG: metalloregulator ArsR/SmtB family transcription factor [Lachnospiraceae bacterium]|nr:metalloregulator ArsR/SmtB family transcription factor [Lachnospiraceae bacterium]
MNELEVFKSLSNETRLKILKWLKKPEENFPEDGMTIPAENGFEHAVCVGTIREKAGISQSVASQYLDMMQRAGLLESIRIGKWTYYRRKEDNIRAFAEWMNTDL